MNNKDDKHNVLSSNTHKENKMEKKDKEKNFILAPTTAKRAAPEFQSQCGEEDPGAALEFLVGKHN